jgi:hypothetical protein
MATTYKNHVFTRTSTTTDTARGVRHIYAIEGQFSKAAARGPWLTSVNQCREYVNSAIYAASDAGQAASAAYAESLADFPI